LSFADDHLENERVVLGSAPDLNHVDLLGDARVLKGYILRWIPYTRLTSGKPDLRNPVHTLLKSHSGRASARAPQAAKRWPRRRVRLGLSAGGWGPSPAPPGRRAKKEGAPGTGARPQTPGRRAGRARNPSTSRNGAPLGPKTPA